MNLWVHILERCVKWCKFIFGKYIILVEVTEQGNTYLLASLTWMERAQLGLPNVTLEIVKINDILMILRYKYRYNCSTVPNLSDGKFVYI